MLTEIDEAAAAIASGGGQPRGRLRISAPLLFSQTAMGRLAADFALRYPAVRLTVTTEDRSVDMVEEGYDLVIRVNPEPDASLVGRVLLRDRLVLVAPPGLARPRKGSSAAVPAVVRGTGAAQQSTSWQITPLVKGRGATFSPAVHSLAVDPVLSLASLIMVRDAVRRGAGVARLPISLVGHDIAAGTLVHWGDVPGPAIELWALYPSRRLLSARVSAFLEHLKEAFPKGAPEELAAYVGA